MNSTSSKITLFIFLALLLLVAAVVFLGSGSPKAADPSLVNVDSGDKRSTLETAPRPDTEVTTEAGLSVAATQEETEVFESKPELDQTAPGIYADYSQSFLANANTGPVVLFFHASWCPSCRTLNRDIVANLESIPEGVTILKLDYDSETELKQKYGVVRQHTLVQVDANGDEIKTLTGLTNSLDQVVSQI